MQFSLDGVALLVQRYYYLLGIDNSNHDYIMGSVIHLKLCLPCAFPYEINAESGIGGCLGDRHQSCMRGSCYSLPTMRRFIC